MAGSNSVKAVDVGDLEAHLSRYLRDVARGEVVLVTDRGRVVAELRAPGPPVRDASLADYRYRRLVERGVIRPAAAPGSMSWKPPPGLRLTHGTAKGLLDEERGE